jgi:regulatory protein
MRRAARALSTEEQLYAAALRALMRRAHSVYEMRERLEGRAEDKGVVRGVLARLKREALLDDARYARQFARARAEGRRQGRYRIARELRARGVADRHIEAALDEVFAETDEAALLRKRIERKLKTLRGPLDQRRLASLYRALLRAGFPADLIRQELRAARVAADLPEEAESADKSMDRH